MKGIKGIDTIRESFKTRQVKYGGYAVLITLAVIAGLILVNLIFGQLSPQLDLTSSKLFSLSEQTLQVLESVETPVKFYGLWRPGEESQEVMTVIERYLSENRNISLEVIDPDRNPGFVVRYDPAKQGIPRGSVIVEGEKGYKVLSIYDMYEVTQNQQGGSSITGIAVERRITSAILFVGTGSTPVVYEITGHGELPLADVGITELFGRENLSLQSLNLLVSSIPADASALILHSPQRDLSPDEAEKLLDYLGQGGRLMVLADYKMGDAANLNEVFASYGLKFDYGIVHETDPKYVVRDPRSELPDLADHEITRPLADKTQTPVLVLEAMSLSALETKRRTVEVASLMTSSSGAFLRTDLNNTSATKTASDISGPLMLGAAVTDPSWIDPNNPEPQTRIVAIGAGGSLLPLTILGYGANRDVFMNSVVWLEDRPESISARSKSVFVLPLRLNMAQIIIFAALFIFVIPVAFFVAGFITWLKRRHL